MRQNIYMKIISVKKKRLIFIFSILISFILVRGKYHLKALISLYSILQHLHYKTANIEPSINAGFWQICPWYFIIYSITKKRCFYLFYYHNLILHILCFLMVIFIFSIHNQFHISQGDNTVKNRRSAESGRSVVF